MKWACFIIGGIVWLLAFANLISAKTALHDIYNVLQFIHGSLWFVGGAIINAIESTGNKTVDKTALKNKHPGPLDDWKPPMNLR